MRFINRSSACSNKTTLLHPHSQPFLATRKISIVHCSINDPQDEEEVKGFWSGQEGRAVCYTISAWRCTDVLSRQLTATATDSVSATDISGIWSHQLCSNPSSLHRAYMDKTGIYIQSGIWVYIHPADCTWIMYDASHSSFICVISRFKSRECLHFLMQSYHGMTLFCILDIILWGACDWWSIIGSKDLHFPLCLQTRSQAIWWLRAMKVEMFHHSFQMQTLSRPLENCH